MHKGFAQSLFATLVADAAPLELRETAYGMFNLVTGIAMLAASIVAGAVGPDRIPGIIHCRRRVCCSDCDWTSAGATSD